MSAVELWFCDVCCQDGPQEDGELVHEDVARDRGWQQGSHRVEFKFIKGVMYWEDFHVCPTCLAERSEDVAEMFPDLARVVDTPKKEERQR